MSLIDRIAQYYENLTHFQAAVAISLIFLYILYIFLRDMDLPPGPKGPPLFGYWPFFDTDTCHLQLQELSKKYGDVFSFRSTGQLFIHLGSFEAIKEVYLAKSEYFQERMVEESAIAFNFDDTTFLMNGERWKVFRKFFLSKFKEYGMITVKGNAASSFYDALGEMVNELHETKGSPMQITDMVSKKIMLVIRRIIFNDQGISMAELQEITDLYFEVMEGINSTNLLMSGTFAKYVVFPFTSSNRRMKSCSDRIVDIFTDVVKRRKLMYNESQVADMVDCYLKERDERRKKGDPTAAYFTDAVLVASLKQFVTESVVTGSGFIEVFLVHLVEYPDEQEKIYKEIVEVIGLNRLPTMEDKNKLPYTNAFINEVVRYTDFFPLFPSLRCTKETTLNGYKIPQGSITVLNLYAANRNPKDFENPDEFNPSRYLPPPGKPRPDLPILFGIGKRVCIGEAFCMNQTFLFLTTIVQNFRLAFPGGYQVSSVFRAEDRLNICATPRSPKSH